MTNMNFGDIVEVELTQEMSQAWHEDRAYHPLIEAMASKLGVNKNRISFHNGQIWVKYASQFKVNFESDNLYNRLANYVGPVSLELTHKHGGLGFVTKNAHDLHEQLTPGSIFKLEITQEDIDAAEFSPSITHAYWTDPLYLALMRTFDYCGTVNYLPDGKLLARISEQNSVQFSGAERLVSDFGIHRPAVRKEVVSAMLPQSVILTVL